MTSDTIRYSLYSMVNRGGSVVLAVFLAVGCNGGGELEPEPDAVALADAAGVDAIAIDAATPDAEPYVTCMNVAEEWCALNAQCGPILPGDFPACVNALVDTCPGDTDDTQCMADLEAQWPDGPIACAEFMPLVPDSCEWIAPL